MYNVYPRFFFGGGVILHIEVFLECGMLFCMMCIIVYNCTVLCYPVFYCSTLPPGIHPFAVTTTITTTTTTTNSITRDMDKHKFVHFASFLSQLAR